MNEPTQYDWYAIRTACQKEFETATILKRLGFEVFLPVELKLRRKTRFCQHRCPTPFPLLVRYLFVKAEAGGFRWRDLFDVSCVHSVVRSDGVPWPITQAQIDDLRKRAHSVQLPNPHRYLRTANEFTVGDQVLVTQGPFAGNLVTVGQIMGRKARIWLDLFGAQQDVEIGLDALHAT